MLLSTVYFDEWVPGNNKKWEYLTISSQTRISFVIHLNTFVTKLHCTNFGKILWLERKAWYDRIKVLTVRCLVQGLCWKYHMFIVKIMMRGIWLVD